MHICKVGKQTLYSNSYLHLLGAYMLSEAITLKESKTLSFQIA
jgi:hypothetical protein